MNKNGKVVKLFKEKKLRKKCVTKDISYNDELVLIEDIINDNSCNKYYEKTINYIERKRNSYKQQDIKKQIHDLNTLISLNEIILKLYESKLRCYYCNKNVKLLYRYKRDSYQWTLDRIDNDKNHSNENTIISCLKCNLRRRVINKDKFYFTVNLNIKKIG